MSAPEGYTGVVPTPPMFRSLCVACGFSIFTDGRAGITAHFDDGRHTIDVLPSIERPTNLRPQGACR